MAESLGESSESNRVVPSLLNWLKTLLVGKCKGAVASEPHVLMSASRML